MITPSLLLFTVHSLYLSTSLPSFCILLLLYLLSLAFLISNTLHLSHYHSTWLFKIPVYLFLLSPPIGATFYLIILSHYSFVPLTLCRTVLGCVSGRGSGLSWLISVCFTTKVSLLLVLSSLEKLTTCSASCLCVFCSITIICSGKVKITETP